MNYQDAFYLLRQSLQPLYDEGEAAAIAHEVMEAITGLSRMERLLRKEQLLTQEQEQQWRQMQAELCAGRPLQYVLGCAWFLGRRFSVNEQVLIPRPETEELVAWIVADYNDHSGPFGILDIGSGSGCIPISLKLALGRAQVASADISEGALAIAEKNAAALHADVRFLRQDFLDRSLWPQLPQAEVLVSNPPYIPLAEKASLHRNVRDYEPGTALFVPDDDPLLFYRALAAFGRQYLAPQGQVYCELHTDHANAARELFASEGYRQVELRQDLHGNNRLLKAGSLPRE